VKSLTEKHEKINCILLILGRHLLSGKKRKWFKSKGGAHHLFDEAIRTERSRQYKLVLIQYAGYKSQELMIVGMLF